MIRSVRLVPSKTPAVLVAVASLFLTAQASAQASADELARRHFESGAAYMEQAEYEDALREFEKAYELSRRPEILLNVATVQERLRDLQSAIGALETYLEKAPEGEHAETVRIRVKNLQRRLESEPKEAPPAEEPKTDPEPPPPAPATAPPSEEPGEGSSRVPAYVLFGVTGAAGIGAIVTGLVAQSEHSNAEDSCAPTCTDDDLSTGRTMALTSTILTGVAVVAGGVGAALFFTSGPSESARSSVKVDLAIAPESAIAGATWKF